MARIPSPALGSLLVLGLLSGCVSQDQWTFGVSRSFFQGQGVDSLPSSLSEGDSMSNGEVLARVGGAVAVVTLSAAADLILLPVTVPVDLWSHLHGPAPAESPRPMQHGPTSIGSVEGHPN